MIADAWTEPVPEDNLECPVTVHLLHRDKNWKTINMHVHVMSNLPVTCRANEWFKELLRKIRTVRFGYSVACPGLSNGISVDVQSVYLMTKAGSHFAKNECSIL